MSSYQKHVSQGEAMRPLPIKKRKGCECRSKNKCKWCNSFSKKCTCGRCPRYDQECSPTQCEQYQEKFGC